MMMMVVGYLIENVYAYEKAGFSFWMQAESFLQGVLGFFHKS
jgi:hypothetical protein